MNVLIASLLAVSVGVLGSPIGGVLVFVACVLVIALRGYLLPQTPAITARYLPPSVARWFGKIEPINRATAVTDTYRNEGRTDVEALLRSAGIVEIDSTDVTDQTGGDRRLTDRFRADWWRRIRRVREGETRTRLVEILDVDPEGVSVSSTEDTGYVIVSADDEEIGRWVSEAAFYADLAVEPTLREWLPTWEEIGDDRRTTVIADLRALLESCPRCEGDLETVENVRRSCCSSTFVNVTVDCRACGARVFTGSYR